MGRGRSKGSGSKTTQTSQNSLTSQADNGKMVDNSKDDWDNGKPLQTAHPSQEYDHDIAADTDEAVEQIEKDTGESYMRSADYYEAVYAYTFMYDSDIRYYQKHGKMRSKTMFSEDEIKPKATDVEEFIKKAPHWGGGDTYRGMNVPNSVVENIKVGKEFDINNGGSASWSTNSNKARNFSNGDETPVIFRCPTQSKGTSIKPYSEFKTEDEVLVSKEARYVVKKKQFKDGRWYVDVEEVK